MTSLTISFVDSNLIFLGRRYSGRSCVQGTDGPVKPVLSKVWDAPSKEEDVLEKSIEDLQVNYKSSSLQVKTIFL